MMASVYLQDQFQIIIGCRIVIKYLLSSKKLLMAICMMSIFGCFSKKKKPETLSGWLESNFPNEIILDHDLISLHPMALFDHKKASILADQKDPEVQIRVNWISSQDGLGLSKDDIRSAMDQSRKDVENARRLYARLRDNGMNFFSVSVIKKAGYILLFKEPDAAMRQTNLERITGTLKANPDIDLSDLWVECMEEKAFNEEFKEIVPFGYWQRGDSYHDLNKILSLTFKWTPDLRTETISSGWTINPESERSSAYMDTSFEIAKAWADTHVPKPFYLEPSQMVMVEPDDNDPMAIRFHFPYFASKPDTEEFGFEKNALGYVTGVYQTDQKTFSNIKKIDEL